MDADHFEPLSVYDAWPRGELDFTPWLAENMDLLSQAVGIHLELVQKEAVLPAGGGRVDVLARIEGEERYVVIENQMDRSDHEHLAGLLNYASHSDSRVLIWIAGEFTQWHQRTMDWLNEGNGLQIYAVQMSVRGTAGVVKERNLRLISGPNQRSEWEGFQYPPVKRKYLDFFHPSVRALHAAGVADRAFAVPTNDQSFPSGFPGITYHIGFWRGPSACAYLYIATDSKDLNKKVFDSLLEYRPDIDNALNEPVSWERHDNLLKCEVVLSVSGSIDDSPEKHDQIREWMLDSVINLKRAIQPRLEKVMAEIGPDSPCECV